MYHEILAINNALRILTKSNLGNRECELHHELLGKYSENFNKQVLKVADFVRERGNPFSSSTGVTQLHNFITGASVDKDAAARLLNFEENSLKHYEDLIKERYIDKTKMLSDTIHKSNLPHFGTLARIEVKKVNKSEQDVTKEIALVQKKTLT